MSSEKFTMKEPPKYVLAKDLDLDIQIRRTVPALLLKLRLLPITTANPDPTWSSLEFPFSQSPQDLTERQREMAGYHSICDLNEVQTSALHEHLRTINGQDKGAGIMWLLYDGVYYANKDRAEFMVVLHQMNWK